ncbi:MAG: TrkH family potassium uptake protein [Clostridia bacterium]
MSTTQLLVNKPQVQGVKMLIGYLGMFMIPVGILCLIPLLILPFYPSEVIYARNYIIPGVSSIFIGFLLFLLIKGKQRAQLQRHQDAVLVTAIWAISILIGAIPIMMSGYNFTHAVFESTSGFTTTGLSIVDVDNSPKLLLLYRSLTHFFGGVGFVLIVFSIVSDKFGMQLYSSEGHSDRLMPNLLKSARTIMAIYSGLIALGTLAYCCFGMSLFDAVNHSIASLSTGGFSTRSTSLAYYNSAPIEIITVVLMFLGNANFLVLLNLVRCKIKNVVKHSETILVCIVMLLFLPILIYSATTFTDSFWMAVRVGLFQFTTALTTTGFQMLPDNSNFSGLPFIFNGVIILCMLIGGGAGSTAGGLKQSRVALMLKSVYFNFRDKLSNKNVIRTNLIYRVGEKVEVKKDDIAENYNFIMVYLLIFALGTIIFSAYGNNLTDSMFEVASSLGTVGISAGLTAPTAPPLLHWVSTTCMFIGRLEIFVVFVAISRMFTRKK